MVITLGIDMITTQMTPFFNLLLDLYVLVYFIFVFPDSQNSTPWGPPFALSSSL